ncbi:hypothetical protein GpartN1_g3887.t1 [Galdieria partita]|uniref:GHMP kinase N-terminal domain-containing protein n=1 Tax=Galdieria partita TaxID=83374 RepID=A0A9C7PWX2_9RHOD|nr:hypothetical protein GpartN1_g3887.t1 [Galdieria partita]
MAFLWPSISDNCSILSRKHLPCIHQRNTIKQYSVYLGWRRRDHLSRYGKVLCNQVNNTRQEGFTESPTETSIKVEQLLQVEEPERYSGNWDAIYESPAKINLFLRILGKRKDGYHNIASLMQAISLRDTLYFKLLDESAEGDIFETDSDEIPIGSSNLAIAAFRKFRKESGIQRYFHVRVEKKIPVKAGLGGGSSNAATALWAANQLTGKRFSTEYLKKWGADLGSDVPFFFSGGTAFCTGRGENVSELPCLFPSFLYIIKPDGSLSTADVYENLDLSKCSTRDPQELVTAVQDGVMWAEPMNDLEESSFRLYPLLSQLKKVLRACGFPVVLMCGSGSALFCLGAPHSAIYPTFEEKLVKHFPVKVFTARFLNRNTEQDVWYLDREEIKTNTVVEQPF